MLYWSAMFLLLALGAGAAGVSGIAGISTSVACGLFLLGAVMAVIALLLERKPVLNKAPARHSFGDAGDQT
jgi:uncharacterized membrane protein YtjA (UPF0391 family)